MLHIGRPFRRTQTHICSQTSLFLHMAVSQPHALRTCTKLRFAYFKSFRTADTHTQHNTNSVVSCCHRSNLRLFGRCATMVELDAPKLWIFYPVDGPLFCLPLLPTYNEPHRSRVGQWGNMPQIQTHCQNIKSTDVLHRWCQQQHEQQYALRKSANVEDENLK